jgi:hypothetical protein
VVNGNVITTTTPGGQHLYVSTLLPANATVTTSAIGYTLNPKAELEPATHRIVVENPANLTDVRFLHVLQGTDATVSSPDAAMLVQSSGGTVFQGALVLDTVVLFKQTVGVPFAGVTYSVPATTAHHYVTGLAPNTGYDVTQQSDGVTTTVTIGLGGTTVTDGAGVLAF